MGLENLMLRSAIVVELIAAIYLLCFADNVLGLSGSGPKNQNVSTNLLFLTQISGFYQLVSTFTKCCALGSNNATHNACIAGVIGEIINIIDIVFRVLPLCTLLGYEPTILYLALIFKMTSLIHQFIAVQDNFVMPTTEPKEYPTKVPATLWSVRFTYTIFVIFGAAMYTTPLAVLSMFVRVPSSPSVVSQFVLVTSSIGLQFFVAAINIVFISASLDVNVWKQLCGLNLLSWTVPLLWAATTQSQDDSIHVGVYVGGLTAAAGIWVAQCGLTA
eukprot:m.60029 g.60029  ORF g.60029 m.60029 type:complete len:274 (-) comp22790_c0_seq2:111-932(-)